MIKRNINIDPVCPIYNEHNESILHGPIICPKIVQVWYTSTLSIRTTIHNENNFKDWLKNWFLFNELHNKDMKWLCEYDRNNFTFNIKS